MPRATLGFAPHRRAFTCIAPACMALCLLMPRPSYAQAVSEADRQAARELFQQGFQLQQGGKYSEALDKFERAQAVFSAPTNLLHIAECQAETGALVESSETYRGLVRLALPKDAPQAFFAAQTQGAAELQQIEPRIPRVRIEVTPAAVRGLTVTIDDQPMNVALVGVDRPIDPGTHKVAAWASGYVREEKAVTLKEKDAPKPVTFALQAQPGAVGPPAPAGYPAPYPSAASATSPYPTPADKPWLEPPKPWTSTGFFFGARLGAAVPTGGAAIAAAAKAGPGVGIEGYFRFAHRGFLGILGEHDFYGAGNATGTSGGSSNLVAGSIGFTTNAEGVGFVMDFFGGYRSFTLNATSPPPGGDVPAGTYGSGEGGLGMGVWIAAGNSFRILPRFEASFGSFKADDGTPAAGSPAGTPRDNGYAVIFFGVSGDYNIDLKPKSPPKTAER